MSKTPVRRVGVLGAGTMGVGIAVVLLRAGHHVVMRDTTDERVQTGIDGVTRFLDRSVELGKLDEATHRDAIAALAGTTDATELADREFIIEAIFEDTETKADAFAELEALCSSDTLFHTNTSTLSVSAIAGRMRDPGRVVGTHYCNPAPLMRLVEVVRGRKTTDAALQQTVEFLQGLGKTTVQCRDTPGFIVNRFLVPFENDCIRALEDGMGTVESIDAAVRGALRYPMGTFRLLDIVGLDIHRAVSLSLYEQLRDPRCAPPPLVDRMIAAGDLGRKVGHGFYSYEDSGLMGT
jgi:3-hydroxybutyryl-CoA dehydrogenase